MHIRQVTVAHSVVDGWVFFEGYAHVFTQGFPLLDREFVRADHANANALAIKTLGVRAHFIRVAPGSHRAIGVNDKVVADGQ